MKKKIELISLVLFALIAIVAHLILFNSMLKYTYIRIGESVNDIAKITAATIEITDEDLENLIEINFNELLENEVNQQLEKTFANTSVSDYITYSYVLRQLNSSQIKYTVETEEEATFYGLEIGTKLDFIWLMDYIVNEEKRHDAYNNPNYYNDIYRYTTKDGILEELYIKEESGYFTTNSEWAKSITGVAPLYTVEGTYVGLLGVDIDVNEYYSFRTRMLKLVLVMFILLVLLLIIILSVRYVADKNEAQKDQLTGLYTRKYYERYAVNKLKRLNKDDSLTVIMLDVDEFKRYNDFYGHIRGDVVISAVCDIIKNSINNFESCPGRFGGEEFVVIVPNITITEGDLLCDKIRKDVEQLNIAHDNGTVNKFVTVSLGVCTVKGKDKVTFSKVLEAADAGLYRAKQNGRNNVVRFYL